MGQKKHKYPVRLSSQERAELNRLTLQGAIKVRQLNRVKILLLADEKHVNGQQTDQAIAEKLDISPATVERIRRRYTTDGLAIALQEQPRSGRPPGISGEIRAQITALACTKPPPGYARWSLRLLADKAVALELIDTISHDAVGNILKKTWLNRT